MIGSTGGLGVEGQGEVADVVNRQVDRRKDGILVVGIGGGGGVIPVQAIGATMDVAGRIGDIGVVVGGARGIVDTGPAGGEFSTGAGGGILEAVLIGQRGDGGAGGTHLDITSRGCVAGTAVGHDGEGVLGIGNEVVNKE